MTVSDKDILAKVESELKFHMDEARVPQDVQLLVYKCGYDSMRIFAGLDDTKEAVRSALKEELPLDYTASPEKRRNMALLLSVGHLPTAVVRSRKAQVGGQAWNPHTAHSNH